MLMDYEGFKSEILKLTGINLSAYKERQMKRRIDSLITKNEYKDYSDYLYALKTNPVLYKEFIKYLTINVSEFFRNTSQWEVLEKEIIPMLLSQNKNLKIWSAACSTGEEPYSLVMMLSKFMPLSLIKVTATDIDKEVLAKAKDGIYSEKSVEGVPVEFLHKYFEKQGEFYRIKDEIKNCVSFSQHNLLANPYPPDCDLIVCRNVLIYFTEEVKGDIYTKFNRALKSRGVLFVGSTEQIILSNKYKLEPIKTFFYQKEGEA